MSMTIERVVNGRWCLLTRVGRFEISTVESSLDTLGLDTFLNATGAKSAPWSPFETMVFDVRTRKRGRVGELASALMIAAYDSQEQARAGHAGAVARFAPASGVTA